MDYNRFVDLSKSYLFCQLQRDKSLKGLEGYRQKYLPFITVSREAGAGEKKITVKLIESLTERVKSEECPWALYDKDLIKKVIDDYNLRGIESLLPEGKFSDIQTMFEELFGMHPTKREMAHNIFKTILNLARMGNVIIVGRGSFYITRNLRNGLHLRLIGSTAKKLKYLTEERALSQKQAEEFIRQEDKRRLEYVKKLFGVDLREPHNYNLVINTDNLNTDDIVEMITRQAERMKARLDSVSHSQKLFPV